MKVIYNNKEVANTTLNYNELFNKPLLNSHELVGNTSLNDIGVYSKPQVDNLIASTRSIKVVSALPTPLVANTMYYVGPDQNNLYHIYLVDSSLTLIDLGMSQDAVYLGGNGIDISSDNEISVVFDNETLMLNSEGELYVRPATENVEGVVSYDNVSIKKNSSGKIYVPTTKSGDRFGVYPFINSTGLTDVGRGINFFGEDASSTSQSALFSLVADDQVVRNGFAPIADPYWLSSRSGVVLTTGSIDNKTLKWDTTNQVGYVNNSNTIVGTTDADKIALTKRAVQKYTYNLANDTTVATWIAPNSDLNSAEFTAIGNYACDPSANAQTLANCPTRVAFRMIVESQIRDTTDPINSTWQFRFRTIKDINGDVYVQHIYTGSTTTIVYGPWRKVLDSGNMSQMPEVIEVNAVTSGTVTTWKGNSYGVSVAESGAGLTSGASEVKRVKGTLALRWTDVQNPTYIALAPVSGDDNYFKFMSGLTNMGTAITPSMITSAHNYTWATASFTWGTVRQSTVWYDAVRTAGNTWHIDFTVSINGSQACLSGTIISNNIAADATPRLYIGNAAANPANVTGILEIYR